MVFGRNFCEKNDKYEHLNPILGKSRVTHDLGWWLDWKAHVRLSGRVNWVFYYLLRFRSYGAKGVQLDCFQRGSMTQGRLIPQVRAHALFFSFRFHP